MVRQWQEFFYDKRYAATPMKNPDFVKLADAHGLLGLRVEKRSEIAEAVSKARSSIGHGGHRLPRREGRHGVSDGRAGEEHQRDDPAAASRSRGPGNGMEASGPVTTTASKRPAPSWCWWRTCPESSTASLRSFAGGATTSNRLSVGHTDRDGSVAHHRGDERRRPHGGAGGSEPLQSRSRSSR